MAQNPAQHHEFIEALCNLAPVIPVLVVKDASHAVNLAKSLVAGGLPVLEVTLRTPAALEVIAKMAAVEGAFVGAGTVLTGADVSAAKAAGARFAVSPGVTDELIDAAIAYDLPLLPGAATASEVMSLYAQGFGVQKFFPAEAAGGARYLAALGGPLPQVKFCPTGGISPQNAGQYLALPNVLCVGGSWVAPNATLEAGAWAEVEALAQAALALKP